MVQKFSTFSLITRRLHKMHKITIVSILRLGRSDKMRRLPAVEGHKCTSATRGYKT